MNDPSVPTPEIPRLSDIRGALSARGVRPSRRFGQNFLTDPALLKRIVSDADVRPGDVVLEVGPGPGALTAALLQAGARVVAVEVDREMRSLLAELLGDTEHLEVVPVDILSGQGSVPQPVLEALRKATDRSDGSRWLHVANLPYQVSATWLADLVWDERFHHAVVTIQREVAERLVAAPGTAAYGPLSVVVQLRAAVKITRRLAPGAFWPPPKVESAVVRIDPLASQERGLPDGVGQRTLRSTVRGLFFARRKRAAKSLVHAIAGLTMEIAEMALRQADIDPARRGETLSPAEVVGLTQSLLEHGAELDSI